MKAYEYTTADAASKSALVEWLFESHVCSETRVLPDGCKDFILKENSAADAAWFISDLNDSSYVVKSTAGERMRGIRLRPGVVLNHTQLRSWLKVNSPASLFGSDQLDEFCIQPDNVADALECLASGQLAVTCVANELGVSQRSLQRLIKKNTGRTPLFWLSLARIRRAGRYLASSNSLGDTAIEAGFSDQAHMSREMKKWFGQTPNQIRADEQMVSLLFEASYG